MLMLMAELSETSFDRRSAFFRMITPFRLYIRQFIDMAVLDEATSIVDQMSSSDVSQLEKMEARAELVKDQDQDESREIILRLAQGALPTVGDTQISEKMTDEAEQIQGDSPEALASTGEEERTKLDQIAAQPPPRKVDKTGNRIPANEPGQQDSISGVDLRTPEESTQSDVEQPVDVPTAAKDEGLQPSVMDKAFESNPTVLSYLNRGHNICGSHPSKSSHILRGSGVKDLMKKKVNQPPILVHMRHGAGMGNMVLDFQYKIMLAWLTERSVVMLSKTMFNFLHSRYVPPEVQLADYVDLISDVLKVPKEKAADEGWLFDTIRGNKEKIEKPKVKTPERFTAVITDSVTQKTYLVDAFVDIAKEVKSLTQSVLVLRRGQGEGQWTARATNFGKAITRVDLHAGRVKAMASNIGFFKGCATRWAFEYPKPAMREFLKPFLKRLETGSFLVAIHVRMGDAFINSALGKDKNHTQMHKLRHTNDRRMTLKSLEKYWDLVNAVLNELKSKIKGKNVLVFLAADTYQVAEQARQHLKHEVVENPGTSIHSNMWSKGAENEVIKIVADWYCLALSTVFLSPTDSTFSRTASDLGMQRFSVIGRMLNNKDVEKLKQMDIKELSDRAF